ncbi:uncharacterized protein LOC105703486 [Orussus abietinus]|uniref:uncharacterized protein LOC105703486 n=1 Tax=Orussus abietinus TaxID=222816 RepID=UPI000625D4BC|nr:uncharacterized protein LOC105703486 [Orussus abietinus]
MFGVQWVRILDIQRFLWYSGGKSKPFVPLGSETPRRHSNDDDVIRNTYYVTVMLGVQWVRILDIQSKFLGYSGGKNKPFVPLGSETPRRHSNDDDVIRNTYYVTVMFGVQWVRILDIQRRQKQTIRTTWIRNS